MAGNPTKWLTGWDFAPSFLTSRYCSCNLDKLTKQAVSTHPTRHLSSCVVLGTQGAVAALWTRLPLSPLWWASRQPHPPRVRAL